MVDCPGSGLRLRAAGAAMARTLDDEHRGRRGDRRPVLRVDVTAGPPRVNFTQEVGVSRVTDDEAPVPRRDAAPEKPPGGPGSSDLIRRARAGDRSALDVLFERMFPWLRKRARGRLPAWARGFVDTGDLVQDVLLHVFRRITRLESTSSIAFRAYLRRAVDHRIQDEMRRVGRRDTWGGLEEQDVPASSGPSPLQELIEGEAWDRYLRALGRLTPRERRLIVGRAELGYSFKQLALVDDRASPDAARIALQRALVRLSREMDG